ncbi:MAG: aspartate aminotransferase family protein [Pelolinea sp.]|nr:aspartate aminotransferase family protein [Pelolinea sp.]
MDKNNTQEIIQKEKDFVLPTYTRLPFVLTSGKGSYVYDNEGNQYLDFGAGIAVSALGHCDDEVVNAIQQQAHTLSHVCNLYHSEPHAHLAEKLCQHSFADKVFFSNSGAEAVEAALKFARKYAHTKYGEGKTRLVAFSNGFHGRTFGALSVTDREKYQAPFRPLVPDVEIIPLNDIEAARTAIDDNTCAVIVEAVQGEGGIFPASEEFLLTLRASCTRHGALLIMDEIQTGFGRTGKLWAHQHTSVQPDIMTLAKALGGGLPMGATLMTDAVAACIEVGDHGSTFGGGPVAAAAALVVLERTQRQDMLDHVLEMSAYLTSEITALQLPQVVAIRSHGLMIGIELDCKAKPFYETAHHYGILLLTAGPNVIRLLPPLTITKVEIDQFIQAFVRMISGVKP